MRSSMSISIASNRHTAEEEKKIKIKRGAQPKQQYKNTNIIIILHTGNYYLLL